MPMIHFEYSSNLKIKEKVKLFLSEVHNLLVQEIKTDLETCRSTISEITDYVIGDGNEKNAYIFMHIQMLPGRSDEIKNHSGKLLLEKIQHYFSTEIKKNNTQLRVYLTETDIANYHGLLK